MNFVAPPDYSIDRLTIKSFLQEIPVEEIRKEIYAGLSSKEKHISSKFFYDEKGSELFEKITRLPEYYPTETEKKILKNLDLSFISDFSDLNIIELGSGDHSKISMMIGHIPGSLRNTLTYSPVDISKSVIHTAAEKLLATYPDITINGFVADFMNQLDIIPESTNSLFCFLGSTIGNLTPGQRLEFLQKMNSIMSSTDFFLLGVDTIKAIQLLEDAYNDSQGITALFNLNILKVVNNICETDIVTDNFRHIAFYNESEKRIEMHLEAKCDTVVKSRFFADEIEINSGEWIHTENSHKFDDEIILEMAEEADFDILNIFRDSNNWFNVLLLKKR
jgi:L-histidine Nalpha-methyltransferase